MRCKLHTLKEKIFTCLHILPPQPRKTPCRPSFPQMHHDWSAQEAAAALSMPTKMPLLFYRLQYQFLMLFPHQYGLRHKMVRHIIHLLEVSANIWHNNTDIFITTTTRFFVTDAFRRFPPHFDINKRRLISIEHVESSRPPALPAADFSSIPLTRLMPAKNAAGPARATIPEQ